MKRRRPTIMRPGHWMLMIVLGVIIVASGLVHHFFPLLFIGGFIAAFGWGMLENK